MVSIVKIKMERNWNLKEIEEVFDCLKDHEEIIYSFV